MNKENLSFDINVFVSSKELYRVEVTENYEDDKFHCVVFDSSVLEEEHLETHGFETEKQVFDFIRGLKKD
tara:strand:- start:421 stop:630 length:210 start_codon:yes stop_codon:yes gene_type:complete